MTSWRASPAFVAITYGAGGSTRERTHDLVVRLVDSPMLPLAHLTCAAHGRAELVDLMQRYRRAGVDNLLALHGDPPLSATEELPEGDLRYAVELVRLARSGFPGRRGRRCTRKVIRRRRRVRPTGTSGGEAAGGRLRADAVFPSRG